MSININSNLQSNTLYTTNKIQNKSTFDEILNQSINSSSYNLNSSNDTNKEESNKALIFEFEDVESVLKRLDEVIKAVSEHKDRQFAAKLKSFKAQIEKYNFA